MLFILAALLTTSVLAQDDTRELLGVCGFYKAAFPNGHAEADLSKPFFDYLPELSELGTEATLSTEDFITELYEPQQAFCQSNSETVDAVVAQLLSGEKLSAENQELLDLTLFEMVVVADEIESEDDRRNLALVYFGCLLGFIAIVVLIGLVEVALTSAGDDCRRRARRALTASAHADATELVASSSSSNTLQRLLSKTQASALVARRALSESEATVTLESILTACVHDVPSFVCTMSTSVLTHAMVSQICGGNSVTNCHVTLAYLEGLMN